MRGCDPSPAFASFSVHEVTQKQKQINSFSRHIYICITQNNITDVNNNCGKRNDVIFHTFREGLNGHTGLSSRWAPACLGSSRLLSCRPGGQPLRLLLLCFLPQLFLSLDELLLLSLPGVYTALVPLQVLLLGRRQVLLCQSRHQRPEGRRVDFAL